MPLGDVTLFNTAKLGLLNGTHDLDTHIYKVALLKNTVVPLVGEIAPTLATYTQVDVGGTYLLDGVVLTIALTESDGVITFDITNDVTWLLHVSNSVDAHWGLVYNNTDINKAALGFIDLGGPINMTTDDIELIWHPKGLFSMQVIS